MLTYPAHWHSEEKTCFLPTRLKFGKDWFKMYPARCAEWVIHPLLTRFKENKCCTSLWNTGSCRIRPCLWKPWIHLPIRYIKKDDFHINTCNKFRCPPLGSSYNNLQVSITNKCMFICLDAETNKLVRPYDNASLQLLNRWPTRSEKLFRNTSLVFSS